MIHSPNVSVSWSHSVSFIGVNTILNVSEFYYLVRNNAHWIISYQKLWSKTNEKQYISCTSISRKSLRRVKCAMTIKDCTLQPCIWTKKKNKSPLELIEMCSGSSSTKAFACCSLQILGFCFPFCFVLPSLTLVTVWQIQGICSAHFLGRSADSLFMASLIYCCEDFALVGGLI